MKKHWWLLAPGLVIEALFLVIPILIIAITSFYTLSGIHILPILTLANYFEVFTNPTSIKIIAFTLELGAIVSVVCLLLGYPISYYLSMHVKRQEYKFVIILLMLMPFWTDWSVRTMTWIPILGREGLLNFFLLGLGILKEPSGAFLFTEFSAILAMVQSYIFFLVGPVFLSLERVDRNLIRAAKTLGASDARILREIVLPLTAPGIVIGSVLVFIMSISDYLTPTIIGGTITTIGQSIINQIAAVNWPLASAIAVVLSVVALGLIALTFRFVNIREIW